MKRVTIYTEANKPKDLSQTPENWLADYQVANVWTEDRPNQEAPHVLHVQSLLSPQSVSCFTAARLEAIKGNKVLLSALGDRGASGVPSRIELFYILLQ
jgi:hypothetical protein